MQYLVYTVLVIWIMAGGFYIYYLYQMGQKKKLEINNKKADKVQDIAELLVYSDKSNEVDEFKRLWKGKKLGKLPPKIVIEAYIEKTINKPRMTGRKSAV